MQQCGAVTYVPPLIPIAVGRLLERIGIPLQNFLLMATYYTTGLVGRI